MTKVKIIGISGSPRRGNTETIVKEALKAAEGLGNVETELITLAGKRIQPCLADYQCAHKGTKDLPCPAQPDDDVNDILKQITSADGIIVGSPVYWGGVTAQLKALFDRSMSIEIQGKAFRNKVGGVVTVAIAVHGGQETTALSIYLWMLINDMIVVGPGPEIPAKGIGGLFCGATVQGFPYPIPTLEKGAHTAVLKDEIGLSSVVGVGKRVAEMAKIVKAGLKELPEEELAWPDKGVSLELFDHYKELKKINI